MAEVSTKWIYTEGGAQGVKLYSSNAGKTWLMHPDKPPPALDPRVPPTLPAPPPPMAAPVVKRGRPRLQLPGKQYGKLYKWACNLNGIITPWRKGSGKFSTTAAAQERQVGQLIQATWEYGFSPARLAAVTGFPAAWIKERLDTGHTAGVITEDGRWYYAVDETAPNKDMQLAIQMSLWILALMGEVVLDNPQPQGARMPR